MSATQTAFNELSVGSLLWVKDPTTEWRDGKIIGVDAKSIDIEIIDTQKVITIEKTTTDYKSMNESSINGVDDMITLSELNEGSLLRNLRIRFLKDTIYTYTGTILVAMNPYKSVSLYSQEMVRTYKGEKIGSLEPHIFAIADDAYNQLKETNKEKSILISGESGAGKTESTKVILQYLTHLSGSHSSVEQLLIESSPILEAFGNAKTSINDNSSRFGKYMEVFFSNSGTIVGGKITQYLLEKSRIVTQAPGDRNYHIFYTLIHGSNTEVKEKLRLLSPKDFHYLKKGDQNKSESVDNSKYMQSLKSAMNVVGFTQENQDDLFRVIAAVLHLGNIKFELSPNKEVSKVASDLSSFVADLLKVPTDALEEALTNLIFRTGRDTIKKGVAVEQAEIIRDTLAKAIYNRLFGWIVTFVNDSMKSLNPEEEEEERKQLSVGVLDIFGFEIMENNSFEQLCINLANETLQSFFSSRIFQIEQEEYEREGISWDKINYSDNSACLNLLYKGKLSLLNLLDEESSFPSATDDSLTAKFHDNHSSSECYQKPTGGNTKSFAVIHYAGKVSYSTIGFLDKNVDSLNEGLINLFQQCSCQMTSSWFERDRENLAIRGTMKKGTKPPTVSGQFRDSLNQLLSKLEKTDPYFIRCIKPNSEKTSNMFNHDLVLKQLRNTGMLETIRIRRLGYPLRLSYEEFWSRYFMIRTALNRKEIDFKNRCSSLVLSLGINKSEYQLGKTMIFMRSQAQRMLEENRLKIISEASLKLTKMVKAMVKRKSYQKMRNSSIVIQKYFRRYILAKKYQAILKAAIVIQSLFRGHAQRKKYKQFKSKVPILLFAIRTRICRSLLHPLKVQADKDAELDALEKKKKEEELLRKLAEEEAERQRQIEEEKKRQALLDNPGFKILGLRQERLALGEEFSENEIDGQYTFQKYAATYFKKGAVMEYSSGYQPPLLAKISPEEMENATLIHSMVIKFASKETNDIEKIFEICKGQPKLIEELYSNVVKVTYKNIDKEMVIRGWYLMSLLLAVLPPTEEIDKYILNYSLNRGPEGYASFCQRIFQRSRMNGIRTNPPTSLEYSSFWTKEPMNIKVYYPRNESIQVTVDSSTTSAEISLFLGTMLKITSLSGFVISVNGVTLAEKEQLMDLIFRKEKEKEKNDIVVHFYKQLFMPDEPRSSSLNSFVFTQLLDTFMNERVPIGYESSLKLSTLLFLGLGGSKEKIATTNLNECIPPSIMKVKDATQLRDLMNYCYNQICQEMDDLSPNSFKEKAIHFSESLPLFFGKDCTIKQVEGEPIHQFNNFNLLINSNGIHAYVNNNLKRELITSLSYNEISEITVQDKILKISFGANKTFGFEMNFPSSIREIIVEFMISLKEKATFFVSLQEHKVSDPLLLSFPKGAVIHMMQADENNIAGWAKGEMNGEIGMFPLQYVEGLVGSEPPPTREALMFQVSIAKEKDRSTPVSLPIRPRTNSGDIRQSVVINVDESKYPFLEYAKRYFATPKRNKGSFGSSTLKMFSGSRKEKDKKPTGQIFGNLKFEGEMPPQIVPTESTISNYDISFSPEPLKYCLLASLEGKKSKVAYGISQNIMRCMGDYPTKKDWKDHATQIIEEGINIPEIRDETYCQIIKQLTNNTRKPSVEKGWWLLNLCTGSFPPSEILFPYLRQFILQSAAASDFPFQDVALSASNKLERTSANGPRAHCPISLEFDSLITKRPIVLKVYFPDQSSRSFHLDSAMTSGELLRRIYRKLDSDQNQWLGCCLYLTTDDFEMSIPPKVYIFDAISEAGIQNSNYKLMFRRKLWLGKEDTTSDALNNLIYHQVLPSYIDGLLICPVRDPEEQLQEVAFLAALQYKASGDDLRKNNNFGELFKKYIPEHLIGKKTKEEWTETILSAYTSLLNGKSQADAKAMFIDAVRKWPFYGSSFFLVKQSFENALPEDLIMCVNVRGIYLLNVDTKDTILFFKMGEIASWTYGPKHFSIKIHDLQSGDKFIFFTTAGEEITDLLEDYITTLVEQKKKKKEKEKK